MLDEKDIIYWGDDTQIKSQYDVDEDVIILTPVYAGEECPENAIALDADYFTFFMEELARLGHSVMRLRRAIRNGAKRSVAVDSIAGRYEGQTIANEIAAQFEQEEHGL